MVLLQYLELVLISYKTFKGMALLWLFLFKTDSVRQMTRSPCLLQSYFNKHKRKLNMKIC